MKDLPLSKSGKKAVDVAINSILQAGEFLKARMDTTKVISYKGPSNLVTDVDIESERQLKESLCEEFPDFGFLGEESGEHGGKTGLRWIVDPVDGTRNYALGVPHFAVSIALVDRSETFIGVTYDPVRNELFHAIKGGGAFINGRRISVSSRTSPEDILLGFDIGVVDNNTKHRLKMVQSLLPSLQAIRIMGSATLGFCYVAAGRLDVYFHDTLAPWDVAAGILIVEEAGGVSRDSDGDLARLTSTSVTISNPILLDHFIALTSETG
mgnify:CR=1 FL=1